MNLTANARVNTIDTVCVVYGKKYNWYAFSYNTSDEITVAPKTLTVPMGVNKDFLYASSDINITKYGNSAINILFERKTARVALDVDARGASANKITSLQATIPAGLLKTGTFNIKDQTVATSDVPSGDLQLSMSKFENQGGEYRKIVYLHSAQPLITAEGASVNVSFPSLAIEVSNNLSGALNTTSTNLTSSGAISFSFSNVSIPIGASGVFKANLLTKGIAYGGATWAPSNLYLHDYSETHRYRFYPHNKQTTDYRTFFSFGGIEPLKYTGVGGVRSNVVNACSFVYPKDRWKTPNRADFSNMTSSDGLITNVLDLLLNLLSLGAVNQPNTQAVHKPYPESRITYTPPSGSSWSNLALPMNKYLPAVGLVRINETPVDPLLSIDLFKLAPGDLSSVTGLNLFNSVHLWTGDELIDLDLLGLNLASVGSQSYLGLIKEAAIIGERRKAVITSDITNISALGAIKILKSNFKNIRCVRNNSWNPNAEGYDPNPVYSEGDTYLPQQLLNLGIQL